MNIKKFRLQSLNKYRFNVVNDCKVDVEGRPLKQLGAEVNATIDMADLNETAKYAGRTLKCKNVCSCGPLALFIIT